MKLNPIKSLSIIQILIFLLSCIGPFPWARADDFVLPTPGTMIQLSPLFNLPILKGIKVHPDNPFRFDFILDPGDKSLSPGEGDSNGDIKQESNKLIKYFLAGLTIPEKDLWVNLSPYEKDRIIPDSFGKTEMGRDLLAEDYMLKQITASLIYPEGLTGKKFWKRVYEETAQRFGTTNIPVNTFNKVWIVPQKAVVYENAKAGTAYVVEAKLKVMLEQDYLSLKKHVSVKSNTAAIGADIIREIVIPELTKEINEGKNFAQLRQIYNSLILATWYKKKIKESLLSQVYENKKEVAGILSSPNVFIGDPAQIYQRYLRAFKKGAFNYIKETNMPNGISVPRKYFSGGEDCTNLNFIMSYVNDPSQLADHSMEVDVDILPEKSLVLRDHAMGIKKEITQDDVQKAMNEMWWHRPGAWVLAGKEVLLERMPQLISNLKNDIQLSDVQELKLYHRAGRDKILGNSDEIADKRVEDFKTQGYAFDWQKAEIYPSGKSVWTWLVDHNANLVITARGRVLSAKDYQIMSDLILSRLNVMSIPKAKQMMMSGGLVINTQDMMGYVFDLASYLMGIDMVIQGGSDIVLIKNQKAIIGVERNNQSMVPGLTDEQLEQFRINLLEIVRPLVEKPKDPEAITPVQAQAGFIIILTTIAGSNAKRALEKLMRMDAKDSKFGEDLIELSKNFVWDARVQRLVHGLKIYLGHVDDNQFYEMIRVSPETIGETVNKLRSDEGINEFVSDLGDEGVDELAKQIYQQNRSFIEPLLNEFIKGMQKLKNPLIDQRSSDIFYNILLMLVKKYRKEQWQAILVKAWLAKALAAGPNSKEQTLRDNEKTVVNPGSIKEIKQIILNNDVALSFRYRDEETNAMYFTFDDPSGGHNDGELELNWDAKSYSWVIKNVLLWDQRGKGLAQQALLKLIDIFGVIRSSDIFDITSPLAQRMWERIPEAGVRYVGHDLVSEKFSTGHAFVLRKIDHAMSPKVEIFDHTKNTVQLASPDKGGIDLTSDKALSVRNNGQGVQFHIDAAMLERFRNVPGFVPVIISIHPMRNIKAFLGITE